MSGELGTNDTSTGDTRWWIGFAGAALLLIAGLALGGPGPVVYLGFALSLLTTSAVLLGANMHRGAQSFGWRLIATGLAIWLVADAIWELHSFVTGSPPALMSAWELMYLPAYPVIAWGITRLGRVPGSRNGETIDSAILAIGLAVVGWVYLAAPYISAGYGGIDLMVALLYPVGDALLIWAVARLLFVETKMTPSRAMLSASLLCLLLSDAIYLQQGLLGTYEPGGISDIGWLLASVAIGVAALHPSVRVATQQVEADRKRLSLHRLLVAIALPVFGSLLFTTQLVTGVRVSRVVIAFSLVALFGLAAARTRGVVRSYNDQLDELDERTTSLEEALIDVRSKEEALRFQGRVLDNVDSFVVAVDAEGNLSYWNDYAEEFFGFSNDHAMGHRWDELFTALPEKDMSEIANSLERDGSWQGDIEVPIAGVERWVRTSISMFDDERGSRGIICVGSDITEERALEDQLRRVQKLEAVGQLAGGVAHDFNNLLAVVVNYAQFLIEDLPEDDPRRADAEEIARAGHRGASLTRQLLTFSRKDQAKPEVLSLNDVVREMGRMLSRTIPEHVNFRLDLAHDLWYTEIDPGHMEQVVMNLVVNARDAMPEGGNLLLKTSNERVEGTEAAALGVTPGRYSAFSVADDGVGMDEETMARIFEPFFTTKEVGKGTGLGLATVYGIVQEAGGAVRVSSRSGQGSTFTILLPFHSTDRLVTSAEDGPRLAAGNGEHVVVAEDEDAVRNLIARMLERNGYEVTAYASPEAAAIDLTSGTVEADLLVTDVVMPGMSGPELAKQARIPTLLMTGYSNLGTERTLSLPTLAKPFGEPELLEAVREVLAGT